MRVTLLLSLAFLACGQRVYLGVAGGTNLTSGFPLTDVSAPADAFGNPASHFQYFSGPRSFIFGVLIEGRLNDRFSIEAEVLHRPMKSTIVFTEFFSPGDTRVSRNTFNAVRAWEFPVMLKYTPRVRGRIQPFLEAGLSFRTQEDALATEPSRFGISAGAGAALRLGPLRFAPTLRYTRWDRESILPRYATKPDQIEVLTSLAYASESRRIGGRKLEIGALAGISLTPEFDVVRLPAAPLFGLTAQMNVTGNISIEANRIYKPLSRHSDTVLTWEFPVLAKYRWTRRTWTPFAEAGPSFRLAGNLNGYAPSHFGGTAGGGLETNTHGFRLAPALRYTRWIEDSSRYSRTNPNALELVFGISF